MHVIGQIFVVFLAATLAGEIFARLRLSPLAGELLAGILIGPHVLGLVHVTDPIRALSALGVVVLLFVAGLETPPSSLAEVGRIAVTASVCGALASAAAAFGVVAAFGRGPQAAAVVALALAASSVGVAARVFGDAGSIDSRAARVVIGAAVVDDVLVLALLPLVRRGGASYAGVAGQIALAVVALAMVGLIARGALRRWSGMLGRMRSHRTPFAAALALCLGFAALAERTGFAALVGAFVAGMALAETKERLELDRRMEPLADFLVPFFFVATGAAMDPGRIGGGGVPLVAAICAAVMVAKGGGAALGALGLARRERLVVGAGLMARTEIPLVVAGAGLTAGLIDDGLFSTIVAAVLVTTLVAPPLLTRLVDRE